MTKQNLFVRLFLIALFCFSTAWQSSVYAVEADGLVNINTASAEEIAEKVSGIGQKRAKAIVEYREKHGAFESLQQLLEIKGVGEKTLEKNRELLTL